MSIHLSCAVCHEEYVALGMTPEIAANAANTGPLCCQPIPPAADSNGSGETPAAGAIFTTRRAAALTALWLVGFLAVASTFVVAVARST